MAREAKRSNSVKPVGAPSRRPFQAALGVYLLWLVFLAVLALIQHAT